MPPKTQRERDAEKRKEKLDLIDQQVKAGNLVIRKMTDKERAKFAPKDIDRSGARAKRRRPR
jgi:hypothetical protein